MSESGETIRSVKLAWELVDKVTAPMKQIDQAIDRAVGTHSNQYAELDEQVTGVSSDIATGLDAAGVSAANYSKTIRSKIRAATDIIDEHKAAIAAIGAAFTGAGYLGLRYFSEGSKDFAVYSDAYRVMTKNVRGDADEFMAAMREASAGTMTDLELITNANRAMALGVGYDVMPKFIETARAAARMQGETTEYMLQSLVTGSGRQSALILDNLGIMVKDLDEYTAGWAESNGLAVKSLTEEQKTAAFLNYVLEHSDDIISKVDMDAESLSETMARSESAVNNFQKELAEGALPVTRLWYQGLEGITAILDDMPAPIKTVVGSVGVLASGAMGLFGALSLNIVAFAMLSKEIPGLIPRVAGLAASLYAFVPASIQAALGAGTLSGALWALAVNPVVLTIGAIVGAAMLLWDIFNRGWDESLLGGAVNWLCEKFPPLKKFVSDVSTLLGWMGDALKAVWEFLQPIVDSLTAMLDNPVVKAVIDTLWAATPMGMFSDAMDYAQGKTPERFKNYEKAWESITGATDAAYTSTQTSTSIVYNIDATTTVSDIKTESMSKEEMTTMFDKIAQGKVNVFSKQLKADLKRSGA